MKKILILTVLSFSLSSFAAAPAGRFTVSTGGGVVTDTKTGLVWQKAATGGFMSYSTATTYCAGLSLEGSGWRLPKIEELSTLVDMTNATNSMDTVFFGEPADEYWSSTRVAADSSKAWVIYFTISNVQSYNATYSFQVRCVR